MGLHVGGCALRSRCLMLIVLSALPLRVSFAGEKMAEVGGVLVGTGALAALTGTFFAAQGAMLEAECARTNGQPFHGDCDAAPKVKRAGLIGVGVGGALAAVGMPLLIVGIRQERGALASEQASVTRIDVQIQARW